MPAKSVAQRQAISIAEHHPDKLYARNRGLLKMSHGQMHDFAATSEKGLPQKIQSFHRGGIVPASGVYKMKGGEMVLPHHMAKKIHGMVMDFHRKGMLKSASPAGGHTVGVAGHAASGPA